MPARLGPLDGPLDELEAPSPPAPSLSVVIPVKDSRGELERCLQGIAASTLRRLDDPARNDYSFEVLVVDDGSLRSAADIAAKFGARFVRLDKSLGPAAARNRGAKAARAGLICFLDADVVVHPETLEQILRRFLDDPQLSAVFGSYDERPAAPNLISQFKNLFHHYVHHRHHERQATTFWSGCGAIRREAFELAGGYDEAFQRPCVEDIELGSRLNALGLRIELDSSIEVTHLKRWYLATLVHSDLIDRAYPWSRLLLRSGSLLREHQLNLSLWHRALAATTLLFAASCFWALWRQPLLVGGALFLWLASIAIDSRSPTPEVARRTLWLAFASQTVAGLVIAWVLRGDALFPLVSLLLFGATALPAILFFRRAKSTVFALSCVPLLQIYAGSAVLGFVGAVAARIFDIEDAPQPAEARSSSQRNPR